MAKELTVHHETFVGWITVDAGLCVVADPAQLIDQEFPNGGKTWDDFCNLLADDDPVMNPLGDGAAIAVRAGYGDGQYPVYVTTGVDESGEERVASITVRFIDEETGKPYMLHHALKDLDEQDGETTAEPGQEDE